MKKVGMEKIKCPNCGKQTHWEGNTFRPFCSGKCKMADLSKWIYEEYGIVEEVSTCEETDPGS